MCDFSLKAVKSRPAQVGDKLKTHNFGTGTSGFTEATNTDNVAVCLLPGTEIAFDEVCESSGWAGMWSATKHGKVAIFRQINKDSECAHHDALEFPEDNGKTVLLTRLCEFQCATVLQLPAEPKNEQEAQDQKRLEIAA